jgi:hypothetical protein
MRTTIAVLIVALAANLLTTGCRHVSSSSVAVEWQESVSRREADLSWNADLKASRCSLINMYFQARAGAEPQARGLIEMSRYRHVLWFVDHHPEDPILREQCGSSFSFISGYEATDLKAKWRSAVDAHPHNPDVIQNAMACDLFHHGADDDDAILAYWGTVLKNARQTDSLLPGSATSKE